MSRWQGKYYTFIHVLELKLIAVLYGKDWFLFWVCARSRSKVMISLSRVTHEERKMVIGIIYAITNSSIKISVFLLQSSNKLRRVHYATAIRFMYIFGYRNLYYRNCESSLHAFTAVMLKYVHNYNDLETRMSLASSNTNAIVMRLKIFTLLYWMDWCLLEAYLWKCLHVMDPFIHD